MECFAHPSVEAVGICKGCGKGVCHACAQQVDLGLACSDSCAKFVSGFTAIQRATLRSPHALVRSVWGSLGLGVVLLGFAGYTFLSYKEPGWLSWFFLLVGLVMLVSAIAVIQGNRRR
jgi:hypothetical protein